MLHPLIRELRNTTPKPYQFGDLLRAELAKYDQWAEVSERECDVTPTKKG